MKNKIIKSVCLIFSILLIFSALISCSCGDDSTVNSTPVSQIVSTESSVNSNNPGNTGSNEDHLVDDKDHNHYWFNLSVDKTSSATSTATLKGKCYTCGDFLEKDVITTVTFDEWKNALSADGLKSFTHIQGDTYTDYDENGSLSWIVEDNIYTETFYLNSDTNTSTAYAENFLAYTFSATFNSFKYNQETRTYCRTENGITTEIGFANGNLFSFAFSNEEDGHSSVNYYVNHGTLKIEAPDYIFDYYNSLITVDALFAGVQSTSQAEKLHTLLSSMSFDNKCEIAHMKNGVLSVYFYVNSEEKDPIFDSSYDFISIVASNGKITSIHIGNNTIEMAN